MIGERLRKARQELGWSQQALAKELGISAPAISQYENEERVPSVEVLIQLSDALHVSSDYILGRDLMVKSDNTPYTIYLSASDLKIIQEIKKYHTLYKRLVLETERQVSAWNKRVN